MALPVTEPPRHPSRHPKPYGILWTADREEPHSLQMVCQSACLSTIGVAVCLRRRSHWLPSGRSSIGRRRSAEPVRRAVGSSAPEGRRERPLMQRRLQTAGDIVTILAGLAVMAVVVARYLPGEERGASVGAGPGLGQRLDGETLGVDFSTGPTLILVLQSDCGFCRDSMPFYRRLLSRARIPVVVVAPLQDAGIAGYLGAQDVEPSAVVYAAAGDVPVTGTPTVLLVDADGVVAGSWPGLLSEAREHEVMTVAAIAAEGEPPFLRDEGDH